MNQLTTPEPICAIRSLLPSRGGLWVICNQDDLLDDLIDLEDVEVRMFAGLEELHLAQMEAD